MSLVSIPFDGGMNEGVDQSQLPNGVFREVQNMRLRRDGQLAPRPPYAALTMTTTSGNTLSATDIWPYRDQLVVTGYTTLSQANANAWAYRDRTAAKWHAIDGRSNTAFMLPFVTNLRDLPRPLPPNGGASSVSVAAGGGYVCTVWHETSTSKGYVLVQRASDGAQILYEQLASGANEPYIMPRVIYQNTSFIIAASDSDDDIRVMTFRPDADTALSSSSQVFGTASQINSFEIAAVRGSSTGFVLVHSTSQPLLAIRGCTVDSAGAVSLSGLFATVNVDAVNTYNDVSICADSSAGVFVTARLNATSLTTAWTYTIAGVASVGPTTDVFDEVALGATPGDHLMSCVVSIDGVTCACLATTAQTGASSEPISQFETRSFAAHAATARTYWFNSRLTSGLLPFAASSDAYVFAGCELEIFKDKETATTSSRDFLGSANALIRVCIGASPARQVAAYLDNGFAGRPLATDTFTDAGTIHTQLCNIALDASTGLAYWARLQADPLEMAGIGSAGNSDRALPVVAEMQVGGTARRQTAELDNQLFVTGALPLTLSGGALLSETSFETPHIEVVTPSNGAGTLTNSGVYSWVVVFRWVDAQGRVHLSPPSKPISSTFGATDDTAGLIVYAPHTLRFRTDIGSAVQVDLYRTQNGGATFRLAQRYTMVANDAEGERLSLTDTTPDTTLAAAPILYTQSQTPVAHAPAPPCKYAVASRSRIVLGGTNDETEVVFSKLIFPGEPIEFAPPGLLGYRKSIGEPVTALMALDEQVIVASAKSLYRIAGAGPDHSGQGEFLDPERIPGLGGVSNWRSVVEVPTGYFFQSDNDKLYFVDRGGAISWVQGQAVRDTLASYPVIVAAAYVRSQNCVFFGCSTSTNTASQLLVFDLRREIWYVDSEAAVLNGITSLAEYDGGLVIVSDGDVYIETQGSFHTSGRVTTGHIRNGSLCSWNRLKRIGIRGTVIGAATPTVTVAIDLEHEDANVPGFQSLGSHTPTEGPGDAFTKFWTVPNQKLSSFKLQITAADVYLNELLLDIEPRRGIARRKPADLR